MDFNELLTRYFATDDLTGAAPSLIEAGTDRMLVDFGLERDRAKRFALWSVLYLLEAAPALDIAFQDAADQDAARNFMDLMAAGQCA